jgi:hypothetical protein
MSFRPKREPRSACDATGGVLGNPTDVDKGGLSEGSAKQIHGRARGSSRNIRQAESHSGTLPQTTCGLCQIFKRPSAAVATSREGHARQEQARQSSTDDRSRHRHESYGIYQDRPSKVRTSSVGHEMKDLNDERLSGRDASQSREVSRKAPIGEIVRANQGTASDDVVIAEHHTAADEDLLD